MDLAELRRLPLFDGLDDAQLGDLLAAATEQPTRRGELLFHEGRPADDWWVLLEGTVALIRQVGTEESVLGYMTEPGQWAGGFAAWDEFGVYFATGRAENPGRVLRLRRPRAAPAVASSGSRSGCTSSTGWSTRCAGSSPPPASARRSSPWARCPPASRTS